MIPVKLYNFYRQSTRRKLLFGLGFVLALYSWFIFRFFNKYARFGREIDDKNTIHYASSTAQHIALIIDIRWTIYTVNKYIFWQNVCRHQAYQAKLLCNFLKIPYQIFVGFKKNGFEKIEGHAWTVVNQEIVTGFCNPNEYSIQMIYRN